MRNWIYRALVIIVILAGGSYAVNWLLDAFSHESTDNAQITGIIVPVSSEIKGRVVKVHVEDNEYVSADDPLVEIFQDDYLKALKEKTDAVSRLKAEKSELKSLIVEKEKVLQRVRANEKVARAEEFLANREKKRYEALVRQKAVSQSHYDNVQSQWKIVHARTEASAAEVAEAEAAIKVLKARLQTQTFRIKEAETSQHLARLNVQRTAVKAPVSGRVAKKNVEVGKYVQAGQSLLALVKEDIWVIANFKETQIKKMVVGQPVEIEVDAYPHMKIKGRIESIQHGTGSVFSLLPPENATGNFIKVVQRVPVKILIEKEGDSSHMLWPGLSVVATVDVSDPSGAASSAKQKARD